MTIWVSSSSKIDVEWCLQEYKNTRTITWKHVLMLNRVIKYTLREKCPNTGFFLVRIWTHFTRRIWLRRDSNPQPLSLTKWLSVRLRCNWLFVRVSLESVSLQISRLFWEGSSLTVNHHRMQFLYKCVCDMIKTHNNKISLDIFRKNKKTE